MGSRSVFRIQLSSCELSGSAVASSGRTPPDVSQIAGMRSQLDGGVVAREYAVGGTST